MEPPSTEWTAEERLALISRIANEIAKTAIGRADGTTFDQAERIRFLASAASEFLEANRDQILNGQD